MYKNNLNSQGHEKNVESLIRSKADVNAWDRNKETPLHTAMRSSMSIELTYFVKKVRGKTLNMQLI